MVLFKRRTMSGRPCKSWRPTWGLPRILWICQLYLKGPTPPLLAIQPDELEACFIFPGLENFIKNRRDHSELTCLRQPCITTIPLGPIFDCPGLGKGGGLTHFLQFLNLIRDNRLPILDEALTLETVMAFLEQKGVNLALHLKFSSRRNYNFVDGMFLVPVSLRSLSKRYHLL